MRVLQYSLLFVAGVHAVQLRGIKFDQDDLFGFPDEAWEFIPFDTVTSATARFLKCDGVYSTKYYRVMDGECHETCITDMVAKAYHMFNEHFVPSPVAHICEQLGFPMFWTSRINNHVISIDPEFDVYVVEQ